MRDQNSPRRPGPRAYHCRPVAAICVAVLVLLGPAGAAAQDEVANYSYSRNILVI